MMANSKTLTRSEAEAFRTRWRRVNEFQVQETPELWTDVEKIVTVPSLGIIFHPLLALACLINDLPEVIIGALHAHPAEQAADIAD